MTETNTDLPQVIPPDEKRDALMQSIAVLDDRNANPLTAFVNPDLKAALWELACLFSGSQLVPSHFRNKPEDCFIIIHKAARLRVDPLLMLQKTFMVKGKPGIEATLLISLINDRGGFAHNLKFRYEGEPGTRERTCIAWAKYKDSDDVAEMRVDMGMAQDDGWASNDKYRSIPDQMLAYRVAGFFGRLFCPGAVDGLHTIEEILGINNDAPKPGATADRTRDLASAGEKSAKLIECSKMAGAWVQTCGDGGAFSEMVGDLNGGDCEPNNLSADQLDKLMTKMAEDLEKA